MNANPRPVTPPIIAREQLDFGLDGDIARHWLGADAFKTRFFDAMSTLFPVGEKFFITCVRDYKDQIEDPELARDIRQFTRQEGQHGIVHTRYNDRLRAQGVRVDRILAGQEHRLFGLIRRHTSRQFSLAITAAAEHITAIMADCFVERPQVFEGADPRIQSLYVWHAMEEMEHKAVAFDVLQTVARSSYLNRAGAMLLVTLLFPFHTFRIMSHMLQIDGFSRWERIRLWARGLWWLYKPGGLFLPMAGKYFSYLKPGFHPWHTPVVASYPRWLHLMEETGDPVEAGQRLHGDRALSRS